MKRPAATLAGTTRGLAALRKDGLRSPGTGYGAEREVTRQDSARKRWSARWRRPSAQLAPRLFVPGPCVTWPARGPGGVRLAPLGPAPARSYPAWTTDAGPRVCPRLPGGQRMVLLPPHPDWREVDLTRREAPAPTRPKQTLWVNAGDICY